MKKINHWINGKNVAGNDYFQTTNPATGEVLAEVASGGEAEVNQAVAAAKEAFPKWANLPMKERARLMRRLGELIDQNVPEIATMETADTGLPIHQTKNVLIPRAGVAVERAVYDRYLESRAVPGTGQHGSAQNVRAVAVDCRQAGRAGAGGRNSGRRAQRSAGLRRDGGRCAGTPP